MVQEIKKGTSFSGVDSGKLPKVVGYLSDQSPDVFTYHSSIRAGLVGVHKMRRIEDSKREGKLIYGGIWGRVFQLMRSAIVTGGHSIESVLQSLALHFEIAAKARLGTRMGDVRKEQQVVMNITHQNIALLLNENFNQRLNNVNIGPVLGTSVMGGVTINYNIDLIQMLVTGFISPELMDLVDTSSVDLSVNSYFNQTNTLEDVLIGLRDNVLADLDGVRCNDSGLPYDVDSPYRTIPNLANDTVANMQVIFDHIARIRIYDTVIGWYNQPDWLGQVLNDDNFGLQGEAGHKLRADQLTRVASMFKTVLTYRNMLGYYMTKYVYDLAKQDVQVMDDFQKPLIPELEKQIESYDFLNIRKDFNALLSPYSDLTDNDYGVQVKIIFPNLVVVIPAIPPIAGPPVPPVNNPVNFFLSATLDTDLYNSDIMRLVSRLKYADYNKYNAPQILWNLHSAYVAILQNTLTGLYAQAYADGEVNYMMQIASKLNANILPIVVMKKLFPVYKTFTNDVVDNTGLCYNTSATATNIVNDFERSYDQPPYLVLDEYIAKLGDTQRVTNEVINAEYVSMYNLNNNSFLIPAMYSDNNLILKDDIAMTHIDPPHKPMDYRSQLFLEMCGKLLGTSPMSLKYALNSPPTRVLLSRLLGGTGILFYFTREEARNIMISEGANGNINWSMQCSGNNAVNISALIEGGIYAQPLAFRVINDTPHYGANEADFANVILTDYFGTSHSRFEINVMVARLREDQIIIFIPLTFEYPWMNRDKFSKKVIARGFEYVRTWKSRDVTEHQDVNVYEVNGYSISPSPFTFCISADAILKINAVNFEDAPDAPLFRPTLLSDYAAYQIGDMLTTSRNIIIPERKNSFDKFQISLIDKKKSLSGITPPGAKFITYESPFAINMSASTLDANLEEIQNRLTKIVEYSNESNKQDDKINQVNDRQDKLKESNDLQSNIIDNMKEGNTLVQINDNLIVDDTTSNKKEGIVKESGENNMGAKKSEGSSKEAVTENRGKEFFNKGKKKQGNAFKEDKTNKALLGGDEKDIV